MFIHEFLSEIDKMKCLGRNGMKYRDSTSKGSRNQTIDEISVLFMKLCNKYGIGEEQMSDMVDEESKNKLLELKVINELNK